MNVNGLSHGCLMKSKNYLCGTEVTSLFEQWWRRHRKPQMRTLNRFITHKEEGEERVEKAIFFSKFKGRKAIDPGRLDRYTRRSGVSSLSLGRLNMFGNNQQKLQEAFLLWSMFKQRKKSWLSVYVKGWEVIGLFKQFQNLSMGFICILMWVVCLTLEVPGKSAWFVYWLVNGGKRRDRCKS